MKITAILGVSLLSVLLAGCVVVNPLMGRNMYVDGSLNLPSEKIKGNDVPIAVSYYTMGTEVMQPIQGSEALLHPISGCIREHGGHPILIKASPPHLEARKNGHLLTLKINQTPTAIRGLNGTEKEKQYPVYMIEVTSLLTDSKSEIEATSFNRTAYLVYADGIDTETLRFWILSWWHKVFLSSAEAFVRIGKDIC